MGGSPLTAYGPFGLYTVSDSGSYDYVNLNFGNVAEGPIDQDITD